MGANRCLRPPVGLRTVYIARVLPVQPIVALLLALAIAIPGGAAIGAAMGARLANHSVADFLRFYRPEDTAALAQTAPDEAEAALAAVAKLPGVVASQRQALLVMGFRPPGGPAAVVVVYAQVDPSVPGLDQPYVLEGHLPDPAQADEVAINRFAADRLHVDVGGHLPVRLYSAEQIDEVGAGRQVAPGAGVADLRVTAIVRRPADLEVSGVDSPGVFAFNSAYATVTPAFWKKRGGKLASYGMVSLLRIRGPVSSVRQAAAKAKLPVGVVPGDQTFNNPDAVLRSTHIESGTLWLLAGLIGLVTLMLVGPAVRRWAAVRSQDEGALRAAGVTGSGLVAIEVVRALPVLVAGAVIAVPLGAVFGRSAAFGTSKAAELDHPLRWSPILMGTGVTVIVLTGLGMVVIGRLLRRRTSDGDPQRLGNVGRGSRPVLARLATSGAPPSIVAGVRLALPSGGRDGTAIRSAVVTVALGVTLLVSALTFSASMSHLVALPILRGWNWDYEAGNYSEAASVRAAARRLRADPDVEAFTGWNSAPLKAGGQRLDVVGLEDVAVPRLPVFSGR
ncbi:MAG: hypothetical protein ACR2MB_02700 [Acidimicrobiales bacterium]